MPDSHISADGDIVQLVAMRSMSTRTPPPASARRFGWLRPLLFIVVPTVIAATYLFGFSLDRFESETRFTIVKPSSPFRAAGPSLSVEEGAKGLGSDDSYAVRDFLLSRDAMRLLVEKADLRNAIARAAGDPLWEFPGPYRGSKDEDLYRYVQSMLAVDYDSSTGITTLRVQAFRPEDAQRIAAALVEGSEALVNRFNDRARGDALHVAEADVARARADALTAEDNLTGFRNKWSVLDPSALSQTVMATIAALSLRLVETAATLDVTVHSQPNSPQIASLRARSIAIQNQIEQERSRLAGSDTSIAPRVSEYERLLLQRDFAAKSFVSALTVLESVRLDAERQQAYVARVVTPQLPDEATSPHRAIWVGIVFLAGLIVFAAFRPTRAS